MCVTAREPPSHQEGRRLPFVVVQHKWPEIPLCCAGFTTLAKGLASPCLVLLPTTIVDVAEQCTLFMQVRVWFSCACSADCHTRSPPVSLSHSSRTQFHLFTHLLAVLPWRSARQQETCRCSSPSSPCHLRCLQQALASRQLLRPLPSQALFARARAHHSPVCDGAPEATTMSCKKGDRGEQLAC